MATRSSTRTDRPRASSKTETPSPTGYYDYEAVTDRIDLAGLKLLNKHKLAGLPPPTDDQIRQTLNVAQGLPPEGRPWTPAKPDKTS